MSSVPYEDFVSFSEGNSSSEDDVPMDQIMNPDFYPPEADVSIGQNMATDLHRNGVGAPIDPNLYSEFEPSPYQEQIGEVVFDENWFDDNRDEIVPGDNSDPNLNSFGPMPDADQIAAEVAAHAMTSVGAKSRLGFCFDIDGVLLHSEMSIPGASETLQHLQSIGVRFVFLTNSGGYHEIIHASNLSAKFNVPIIPDQLIQSHTPFRDMVEKYGNRNILVIGGEGECCRWVAEMYGFKSVIIPADIITANPNYWPYPILSREHYANIARPLPAPIDPFDPAHSLKISAIFVFSCSNDWALDCQVILDLLLSSHGIIGTVSSSNGNFNMPSNGYQQNNQPPIFFSNSDLQHATDWPHSPRVSQGAFITALEALFFQHTNYTAQLQSTKIGKPYPSAFVYAENALLRTRELICAQLGFLGEEKGALEQVFMIGDNPNSDIDGAQTFKSPNGVEWSSALVETGVWKQGQLDGFPTVTQKDVKSAVNWVLNTRGLPTML